MFKIGNYIVRFHHFDNSKKGLRRRRLTTCVIEDDVQTLLTIGRAQYRELDVKEGLPYDKGFGRRLSLRRALEGLSKGDEFGREFTKAVWDLYFSKVSVKEQGLR